MRLIKKFTAVLLAATLIIGVRPAEVLANKQTPVGSLSVTATSTPTEGKIYALNLTWSKPVPSTLADSGTPVSSKPTNGTHDPEGYRIQYRDVSTNANSAWTTVILDGSETYTPPADQTQYTLSINVEMEPARVYEFRVRPYHKHTVVVGRDPETGNDIIGEVEASPDDTRTDLRVLFFTDLTVGEPEGAGNQITVSWLAPKYANQRVFDQYRVYWTEDTREWDQIIGNNLSVFQSSVIDVRTPNGLDYQVTEAPSGASVRYTCTFTSNDLNINRDYRLIVEPWVNGSLWRRQTVQSGTGAGMAPNPNGSLFTFNTRPPDAPNNGVYVFQYPPFSRRTYSPEQPFRVRLSLLPVLDEDDDNVRIRWNPAYINDTDPHNPDRPIYIYMAKEDGAIGQLIGYLGRGSTGIHFWIAPKPTEKVWYYIILGVEEGDPLAKDRKSNYEPYDPRMADFHPYSPDILSIRSATGLGADLTWKAFIRNIYNESTEGGNNINHVKDEFGNDKYLDTDVSYEIAVSDTYDELGSDLNTPYVFSNTGRNGAMQYPEPQEPGDEWTWAYQTGLPGYFDGQTQQQQPFTTNKVYYVRIVGVRDGVYTQAAYGSFYIPGGDVTAPPMMARPPLRAGPQEPDVDALYISWKTKWHEVYNDHTNPVTGRRDQPEGWYASIGRDSNGYVYGRTSNASLKMLDLSVEEDYNEFLSMPNRTLVPVREIDISGADYEVYVAEFDRVLASTRPDATQEEAAHEYLFGTNGINNPGVQWQQIARGTPLPPDGEYLNVQITQSNDVSGSIRKNTSYVVFFRPVGATGLISFYPVYVTCITPDERKDPNVIPTVPGLYVDRASTTSRSVTVYWELSPVLTYTLAYGDLMSQYPAGGTTVSYDAIRANGEVRTVNGIDYWYYTVEGLFPMTEYHFWIRSEVPAPSATPPSAWSNPVSEVTKDFDAPQPPQGLGLASKTLVNEYNEQFSTEFTPMGKDYFILQWRRDYNDDGTETTSTVNGGDAARLDPTALPSYLYMAKFSKLVSNRDYYVRAKTILTALRTADGIALQYSYRVQVSETDDFVDVIEIYVPALAADPALKRDMIRKESDWTRVLRFKTNTSGDDYDSEWDPRLYPLPASDFEITYTASTGELKYRFRSMGVAADGTHDNQVDQRFISRMIRDRVYIYELDLTRYRGYNVRKRTLEIPYSIVRAMDERKVSLRFVADNLTLTIAPDSLLTQETAVLNDFSAARTAVRYSLDQNPPSIPVRASGENYASVPHALSVTVTTPTRTARLSYLNQALQVALKLDTRYTVMNENVGAYQTDNNTAGWAHMQNRYDNAAGTMTFDTKTVGVYSAIARQLPVNVAGGNLPDAAYTLTTRLNITDLPAFHPSQPINASQFNNIVAAIARDKDAVAIYESMSNEDYQSLGRSGILVSGSEVTREAGIHAIVRLYEIKTNATVKNYATLSDTMFADIASANASYQTSLLKAAKIGLFNSPSTRPKDLLTMNDAFEMFAIIIEDAGL